MPPVDEFTRLTRDEVRALAQPLDPEPDGPPISKPTITVPKSRMRDALKPPRISLEEAEAALRAKKAGAGAQAAPTAPHAPAPKPVSAAGPEFAPELAPEPLPKRAPAPTPAPRPAPTPKPVPEPAPPPRPGPTPRTTMTVTSNAIVPPAPSQANDPGAVKLLEEQGRWLAVVAAQMQDAQHRLKMLEERVGAILITLPETRRPITIQELQAIYRDAPSTELEVINTPIWRHHHLTLEAGRRVKPSHYRDLIGWVGKGLKLAVVDPSDRHRPSA